MARSPSPAERPARGARARDPVAAWLALTALGVAAMVAIGGVTRLTGSGLSMVEWRPATGWLPPLAAAEWERVFALYRHTPEFRQVHPDMDLAGFRAIFWWEYVHRLAGRLLGLLFALPLAVFWIRGRLDRPLRRRLLLLLGLGALQGLAGWWMVRSGLVDRPEVSAPRLAAHLGLALAILALLVWTILDRVRPGRGPPPAGAWAVPGLVALAVLSGALVAGTDGGLVHNDFPLMGGALWPEDYAGGGAGLGGLVANALTNPSAAQFHHRLLALAAALAAAAAWLRSGGPRAPLPERALLAAALAQAGLGIATLLSVAALPLAVAHQAGAVLLLVVALWRTHALGRRAAGPAGTPPPNRP